MPGVRIVLIWVSGFRTLRHRPQALHPNGHARHERGAFQYAMDMDLHHVSALRLRLSDEYRRFRSGRLRPRGMAEGKKAAGDRAFMRGANDVGEHECHGGDAG